MQHNFPLDEPSTSATYTCDACGRFFGSPGPLNYHSRSCVRKKHHLKGILTKIKGVWAAQMQLKKTRLESQRAVQRVAIRPAPSTQRSQNGMHFVDAHGQQNNYQMMQVLLPKLDLSYANWIC